MVNVNSLYFTFYKAQYDLEKSLFSTVYRYVLLFVTFANDYVSKFISFISKIFTSWVYLSAPESNDEIKLLFCLFYISIL